MLVGLISETERNLLKPPAFGGFVFVIASYVVCVKNSVLRAGVLFFISLRSATCIKKAEFTREMRLLIPILYFVKIKKEGNAYTYYSLWPMLHA